MCREDPCAWVNTFVWTYDPRRPKFRRIPMILYPYEEDLICELLAAKGIFFPDLTQPYDVHIGKSRDLGATICCVIADLWPFEFVDDFSSLWLSRKEEYVDSPSDPRSLFWKARFILRMQPHWLGFHYNYVKLRLTNPRSRAMIGGESANPDAGRGDRRTTALHDEFASVEKGEAVARATHDVSDNCVYNSTPKGTANEFYRIRKKPEVKKIELHWSQHPKKGAGLYTFINGQLTFLDQTYHYPTWRGEPVSYIGRDRDGNPTGYKFVLDGKLRSPWYDREENRRGSKVEMAQEVDIDYFASGAQYFDQEVLDQLELACPSPLEVGELRYNPDTGEPTRFDPLSTGRLSLWIYPTGTGLPPMDRNYSLGVDVSAGSDASNSVASGADARTGEQVCELVTINVLPHEFAIYALAVAKFFRGTQEGAFTAWEANGPGGQFGTVIVRTGFRNIYFRTKERSLSRKQSDEPGWYNTTESKQDLLGAFRRSLARRDWIPRSKMLIEEAREYVHLANGSVGFERLEAQEDPSGAKFNHGDRVMGGALSNLGIERVPEPRIEEQVDLNGSSFIGRRLARLREREGGRKGWVM